MYTTTTEQTTERKETITDANAIILESIFNPSSQYTREWQFPVSSL
jgi:hypothetical protein